MSTLPVFDTTATLGSGPQVVPHVYETGRNLHSVASDVPDEPIEQQSENRQGE